MGERRGRFEAEVLVHLDAAYRFARWLGRSEADAEDVVQEAMLRAWRAFDARREPDAKAWLLAIVRNCASSLHRREQRRGQVPLPEEHEPDAAALVAPSGDPEGAAAQLDEQRVVRRLLTELPEEQREVLVLRELEELNYREIAAVINVPIGTVMSRLARARGALKALWTARTEGESLVLR
jgi:RNA polymerase sigma-70 factor (ECF subfamily)